VVLCLSQDGACTDSFENFHENSLKGDLSNDITLNPSLFSLVNTFKGVWIQVVIRWCRDGVHRAMLQLLILHRKCSGSVNFWSFQVRILLFSSVAFKIKEKKFL
jgi:hypothetical protein